MNNNAGVKILAEIQRWIAARDWLVLHTWVGAEAADYYTRMLVRKVWRRVWPVVRWTIFVTALILGSLYLSGLLERAGWITAQGGRGLRLIVILYSVWWAAVAIRGRWRKQRRQEATPYWRW